MNLAGAPASGIAHHGGADHRCAARGATPRPHREHCWKSGAPSVNRVRRQMGANSVRSPRVAGRFPVRCPARPTACPSHEEWRLAERQPPSLAPKGSARGSRPAPEASLRFIPAKTAGGGTRAAFGRRSIPAEPPPHRENWRFAALIVAFRPTYIRYSGLTRRVSRTPTGRTGPHPQFSRWGFGAHEGFTTGCYRAAWRPSSLRFRRNTPGIPPSRALSAGRLAPTGRNAHARVLPPTPPA